MLFDGAWLWEEYTNTILKDCGFKHPRNDLSKGGIYLFKKPKRYIRYPDFWKEGFIIDAKYKGLDDNGIDRNDMNQIISYMYVKEAKIGGFIYPKKEDKTLGIEEEIGELDGYSGIVKTWGVPIPTENLSFKGFCESMHEKEVEIKEIIRENE